MSIIRDSVTKEDFKQYHKLQERIKNHEGFSKKLYKCPAGKLTIGYGRNIEDNGITQKEADLMLETDVDVAIREVREVFDDFKTFGKVRQNALIDMMFNLGKPTFLKFKKMIKAIKIKDWVNASEEARKSLWYNQVGDRSKRIVKELREG